eukprot:scaffold663306_cov25-Prasinocladus_malaysianus.AAC.1
MKQMTQYIMRWPLHQRTWEMYYRLTSHQHGVCPGVPRGVDAGGLHLSDAGLDLGPLTRPPVGPPAPRLKAHRHAAVPQPAQGPGHQRRAASPEGHAVPPGLEGAVGEAVDEPPRGPRCQLRVVPPQVQGFQP